MLGRRQGARAEGREDKGHAHAVTGVEDRLKAGLPTGCDFVCHPAFRRKSILFTPFAPGLLGGLRSGAGVRRSFEGRASGSLQERRRKAGASGRDRKEDVLVPVLLGVLPKCRRRAKRAGTGTRPYPRTVGLGPDERRGRSPCLPLPIGQHALLREDGILDAPASGHGTTQSIEDRVPAREQRGREDGREGKRELAGVASRSGSFATRSCGCRLLAPISTTSWGAQGGEVGRDGKGQARCGRRPQSAVRRTRFQMPDARCQMPDKKRTGPPSCRQPFCQWPSWRLFRLLATFCWESCGDLSGNVQLSHRMPDSGGRVGTLCWHSVELGHVTYLTAAGSSDCPSFLGTPPVMARPPYGGLALPKVAEEIAAIPSATLPPY